MEIGEENVMTQNRKLKCKYCSYKGFRPLLRLHMYLEHREDMDTGEVLQLD